MIYSPNKVIKSRHFRCINLDDWVTAVPEIPNCPRGLEYLSTLDQLMVKQKVELMEAITGFEGNNKYIIKNSSGQNVRRGSFSSTSSSFSN